MVKFVKLQRLWPFISFPLPSCPAVPLQGVGKGFIHGKPFPAHHLHLDFIWLFHLFGLVRSLGLQIVPSNHLISVFPPSPFSFLFGLQKNQQTPAGLEFCFTLSISSGKVNRRRSLLCTVCFSPAWDLFSQALWTELVSFETEFSPWAILFLTTTGLGLVLAPKAELWCWVTAWTRWSQRFFPSQWFCENRHRGNLLTFPSILTLPGSADGDSHTALSLSPWWFPDLGQELLWLLSASPTTLKVAWKDTERCELSPSHPFRISPAVYLVKDQHFSFSLQDFCWIGAVLDVLCWVCVMTSFPFVRCLGLGTAAGTFPIPLSAFHLN